VIQSEYKANSKLKKNKDFDNVSCVSEEDFSNLGKKSIDPSTKKMLRKINDYE
jgi:hypothetical protein